MNQANFCGIKTPIRKHALVEYMLWIDTGITKRTESERLSYLLNKYLETLDKLDASKRDITELMIEVDELRSDAGKEVKYGKIVQEIEKEISG